MLTTADLLDVPDERDRRQRRPREDAVLILTSLAGIEDKVSGLGFGADDLHDQAVPQGRAGWAHSRHRAPL
jgi:hypothetical protein